MLTSVIFTSLLVLMNTLAALNHKIIKILHIKKPSTMSENVSIEANYYHYYYF